MQIRYIYILIFLHLGIIVNSKIINQTLDYHTMPLNITDDMKKSSNAMHINSVKGNTYQFNVDKFIKINKYYYFFPPSNKNSKNGTSAIIGNMEPLNKKMYDDDIDDINLINFMKINGKNNEDKTIHIKGCLKEVNIKYMDNSIDKKIVKGIDECANWCGEIQRCQFWTFQKSDNLCRLMTSNSDRKTLDGYISGSKSCAVGCLKEYNIKYMDKDIDKKVVGGIDECANWCGEIQGCKFWTLQKSNNLCFIKTSNSDRQSLVGYISGTKSCALGNKEPLHKTIYEDDMDDINLMNFMKINGKNNEDKTIHIKGCVKEVNIKYMDNCIDKKIVKGIDECANWCGETQRCQFWTLQKSDNLCCLTTSNSDRKTLEGYISGSKCCATGCLKEYNIKYMDKDIDKKRVGGIDECANWCGEIHGCKFWTLQKSNNLCFIKTSNSDRQSLVGYISGTKSCALDGGEVQDGGSKGSDYSLYDDEEDDYYSENKDAPVNIEDHNITDVSMAKNASVPINTTASIDVHIVIGAPNTTDAINANNTNAISNTTLNKNNSIITDCSKEEFMCGPACLNNTLNQTYLDCGGNCHKKSSLPNGECLQNNKTGHNGSYDKVPAKEKLEGGNIQRKKLQDYQSLAEEDLPAWKPDVDKGQKKEHGNLTKDIHSVEISNCTQNKKITAKACKCNLDHCGNGSTCIGNKCREACPKTTITLRDCACNGTLCKQGGKCVDDSCIPACPAFIKILQECRCKENVCKVNNYCVNGSCLKAIPVGWSKWSTCSKTCGSGQRVRICYNQGTFNGGKLCEGPATEHCHKDKKCSVPGKWSNWSECSKTCGRGSKARTCTNPAPINGGKVCEGKSVDFCSNEKLCAVPGGWSNWSACNKTCGPGKKIRICNNPAPINGGKQCEGESVDFCIYEKLCALSGGWSEWSTCSKSCGGGKRARICFNPSSTNGEKLCEGPVVEDCNKDKQCSVPGEWSNWSVCSKTCGHGSKTRTCTKPAPINGGKQCEGQSVDICINGKLCNSDQVPTLRPRGSDYNLVPDEVHQDYKSGKMRNMPTWRGITKKQ